MIYKEGKQRNNLRDEYMSAHYRIYKKGADEYLNNNIYASELKFKNPPSKNDIEEVRLLLRDFGIRSIEIPEFGTYADLNRWKNECISDSIM